MQVLPVDVKEGDKLRAYGKKEGATVAAGKIVTGSITTYWKLKAWCVPLEN